MLVPVGPDNGSYHGKIRPIFTRFGPQLWMPGASLRASSTRTPSRHRQNNIENQPFEQMAIRKIAFPATCASETLILLL